VVELVKAINDFVAVSNEKAQPFKWIKTADQVYGCRRAPGRSIGR
jgi:hypothetical protein